MQISDMENEMKKIISPDSGLETEATEDTVKGPEAAAAREKAIVRTSVIGIVANVFLAGFKALVGAASGSIAIILDAVNNLSDAMSSVITILGTKLARKAPDKKHPLGYGRIEYLSAMIVAAIVLYAGITSFTESLKKIIHPESARGKSPDPLSRADQTQVLTRFCRHRFWHPRLFTSSRRFRWRRGSALSLP